MPLENNRIATNKLILTEGRDAQMFLIHMLKMTGLNKSATPTIQVFDYGGIKDLTGFIKNLAKMDGFDSVESLVIARDAETSATSAIQSVNNSLKANAIINSDIHSFKIVQKAKKVGILIFPGLDENQVLIPSGTLEDLCIRLFTVQNIINTVDAYLADFQSKNQSFSRPHKNKLHASLSFTDAFVGMKLGETANAQGFDFSSPWFAPFLNVIQQM